MDDIHRSIYKRAKVINANSMLCKTVSEEYSINEGRSHINGNVSLSRKGAFQFKLMKN